MADVFFSVGTNTSDLKTGSPTITISAGVATFSVAQTGNIGVGDYINYDTDNKICYLKKKLTTSTWLVTTGTGANPTNISSKTVNSIKRTFNSLSAAINGAPASTGIYGIIGNTSLVTLALRVFIACYADGDDGSMVTISSSWATNSSYYFHIFAPKDILIHCNQNQRHNGTVNGGGYTLKSSNSSTYVYNLFLDNDYTRVEGIRVWRASPNWSYAFGIGKGYSGLNTGRYCQIYNCMGIAEDDACADSDSAGIIGIGDGDWTAGYGWKIFNNIIISRSTSTTSVGLGIEGSYNTDENHKHQVYNNTVYGYFSISAIRINLAGTDDTYVPSYIKNNYTYNSHASAPDYTFAGDASNSDSTFAYNRSDDTSAGSSNNNGQCTRANAAFINETFSTMNLHIGSSSSLIGVGIGPFSDNKVPTWDVTWHKRSGTTTDVGAHSTAISNVFFSVGTNTSDLKTGSPTITISAGVATFSVAQTGNIGIGDVITYDTDSKIAFITGKNSTTEWTVSTNIGLNPEDCSGISVTSIKRAFNSIVTTIAGTPSGTGIYSLVGNTSNLSTAQLNVTIACYKDGEDVNTGTNITGWTTSTTCKIIIMTPYNTTTECNTRQRHTGTAGTGYTQKCNTNWSDFMFYIRTANVVIDGIDGYGDINCGAAGITHGGDNNTYNNLIIRNCIIRNFRWGYNINLTYNCGISEIYNNIIYRRLSSNSDADIAGLLNVYKFDVDSYLQKIYNNVIFSGRGQCACVYLDDKSASHQIPNSLFKNNVVYNANDNSSGTIRTVYMGSGVAFSSSYLTSSGANSGYNTTNNSVDFKGSSGSGTQTNKSNTDIKWTNIVDGSENFLPTSGSCLAGFGIGPASDSNVSTLDIIEVSRSGNSCTIGAFEIAAAITIIQKFWRQYRQRRI